MEFFLSSLCLNWTFPTLEKITGSILHNPKNSLTCWSGASNHPLSAPKLLPVVVWIQSRTWDLRLEDLNSFTYCSQKAGPFPYRSKRPSMFCCRPNVTYYVVEIDTRNFWFLYFCSMHHSLSLEVYTSTTVEVKS